MADTALPAPVRASEPWHAGIDRGRYRRVLRFLAGVLAHALWWDVVLSRPVLRRLRTPPLARWSAIARRYRELALELGGVLIKLGQFLSTRVDVLPESIIRELAGLQDEVPAAPFPAVLATIEADLGRGWREVFTQLDEDPVGAASLAQVHHACLPSGESVVVKILRPGIGTLVETDLAALRRASRWLALSKTIRRRVDVVWLEREFRTVTRRELDLVSEGHNIERFAADFADDPGVAVPRVYWAQSGRSCLTLEDVGAIKITDRDAMIAAGVDPSQVARRLYAVFMQQFFVTHFVHADPHPGNIFVRPVPQRHADAGETAADTASTPFVLAFVDFGMMTEIPERLRAALREFAIGLGTRDARRMVASYVQAGTLLEEADLDRLIAAHEDLLERFWGIRIGRMRDVAIGEARDLMHSYHDLLLSAPIQVQADMLFALRAVGLLAGLCTSLDPDFDPWAATVPFAERFAGEAASARIRERVEELLGQLGRILRLPDQLDALLARADRSTFGVRANLAADAGRRLDRLHRAVARLTWTIAAAGFAITGVLLKMTLASATVSNALLTAAALAAVAALLPRRGNA